MDKKYRVPRTAITEKGLRKLLKDSMKDTTCSAWAQERGITPQAVSSFIRGIQTAGLQVPEALGYRPQTIYLPLDEDPIFEAKPPRRATDRPSKKVDHTKEPVNKRGLLKKNPKDEARRRILRRSK